MLEKSGVAGSESHGALLGEACRLREARRAHAGLHCRGEYVRDHIAGSRVVLLNATGHCPNLSAPEAVTAAIRPFCSDPGASGPEDDQTGVPAVRVRTLIKG
jgi:hypothetical protein